MTDRWPVELARAAAELFAGAEGSRPGALHRLTDAAGWRVPGCCGASGIFWERDRMTALAATHPNLAALPRRQIVMGEGPVVAALRSWEPVVVADTVREDRWPRFGGCALAAGVRSSATVAHGCDSMILTLTLYRTRPAAHEAPPFPLVPLLAALGAARMPGAAGHIRTRRTAARLQEAITSRATAHRPKAC